MRATLTAWLPCLNQMLFWLLAAVNFYTSLLATGFVYHAGEPYPAILNGELALTSSRYPNGTMSSEVARRQEDGTWLWAIDYPTIGE